ncbi:hypothetical protein NKG05_21600 [Oerskovia sp. M15]
MPRSALGVEVWWSRRPRPPTPGALDARRRRAPGRRRAEIPAHQRWAPRMAVLGTLAVATIAMPLSAGAQDGPSSPSALTGARSARALSTW